MPGITARTGYGPLQKPLISDQDIREEFFITGQPIGSNRRALDTIPFGTFFVQQDVAVGAASTDVLVEFTAHGARKGDVCRIQTTAGNVQEYEVAINEIIDANTFKLASVLSASLQAGDIISILRPVMQRMTADGATLATVQAAPVSFNLDGSVVEVTEDTAVPGNNIPLPVKLTGITGDINITAGDLNVQLSHLGVNADVTRIGDGVEEWQINAAGEGTVHDAGVLAELVSQTAILTELENDTDAIIAELVTLNANDFSTEAKQDTIITSLNSIDAKFGSLGQKLMAGSAPVVIASDQSAIPVTQSGSWDIVDILGTISLPTGAATSANQATEIASLSSIDTKLSSQATAANQATMITSLGNIDTDLGAAADAAVTNPASSASVIAALKGILSLVTSTNTKLDTIDANTSSSLQSSAAGTSTSGTITAPGGAIGMIVQNSTRAETAARFTESSGTPSGSVGYLLEPGQSTSYMPAGTIKYSQVDGGNCDITVLWFY